MSIFYSSSDSSGNGFSKAVSLFLLFLALFFLFGGIYVIYFILRLIFLRSFILGILFLFFGLPVLGKFMFVLFFGIFSSLLAVLLNTKKQDSDATSEDDGVIDVKYKIIK